VGGPGTGNFIGVVFARSLHYQFYSWYFHSIPFLLWCGNLSTAERLATWMCIEVIWNVYPSTPASSLMLLACHVVMLKGMWTSRLGAEPFEMRQRA
jgi:alpha-1,3-mannosyltransferase